MASATTTICCLGAGRVGGPSMAVLAAHCPHLRVLVVDVDAPRIAQWNSPAFEPPIPEPGLAERLRQTRGRNLFFSTDIAGALAAARLVFLCVDTPTKASGLGAGSASDTHNCEDCIREIAAVATGHTVIVEKSTVPVRSAAAFREVFAANRREPTATCEIVSNPEFLAEGSAIADLERPSRVLIGADATSPMAPEAVAMLVEIYAHWVPQERILTTDVWSAELAKLVANAFLAQRLSSINAISAVCEATGANVHEVAGAVGADARLGRAFLTASVGFGGSSLAKDVLNLVYLAESLDLPEVARYWRGVVAINDYQKRRFVRTILRAMFHTVADKRLAVLGFAYKRNTHDPRGTPAGDVVRALLEERAVVAIHDPHVSHARILEELGAQGLERPHDQRLVPSETPYEAATGAHAVIVVTDWDGLGQLDFARLYGLMAKPAFFFDGRNVLPHARLRALGAEVHAIGQAEKATTTTTSA